MPSIASLLADKGFGPTTGNPAPEVSVEQGGIPQQTIRDALRDKGVQVAENETPKASALDKAQDVGVSLAKGVVGVPEGIVGLADIPTLGKAGKAVKNAGVDFERTQNILSDLYSPEQKEAQRKVQEANGFIPTLKAIAENPTVAGHTVIQSAPAMIGGQAAATGLLKAAPKMLSPLAAGTIGEGLVTAGQNTEQARQQSTTGELTPEQVAIQAGSGALTGAIGYGAGKLAKRLGVGDVQTAFLGDTPAADMIAKSLPRRVVEEAGLEAGQEGLQSYQEQAAGNISAGKPWDQGAANAAALGTVAGAGMGGPMALASNGNPTADTEEEPVKASPVLSDAPTEETPAPGQVATPTPDQVEAHTPEMTDEGKKRITDFVDKWQSHLDAGGVPTTVSSNMRNAAKAAGVYDPKDTPNILFEKLRDFAYPKTEVQKTTEALKATVDKAPDGVFKRATVAAIDNGITQPQIDASVKDTAQPEDVTPVEDVLNYGTDVDPNTGEVLEQPPIEPKSYFNAQGKPFSAYPSAANLAIELSRRNPDTDYVVAPVGDKFIVIETPKTPEAGNAEQINSTSAPNGDGSAQPPESERAGNSAIRGEGVQPEGQENRNLEAPEKIAPTDRRQETRFIPHAEKRVSERRQKARDAGLADEQILSEIIPDEPTDAVTGFAPAYDKDPTIAKALEHVSATGGDELSAVVIGGTGGDIGGETAARLSNSTQARGAAPVDAAAEQAEINKSRVSDTAEQNGEYKKPIVDYQGIRIGLENAAGSERKGTDAQGKSWSVTMVDNYGEIEGTKGADGDKVDAFIKPGMSAEEVDKHNKVFIIDQVKPGTTNFDEHKVILGYDTAAQAKKAYLSNYSKGWQGLGAITAMPMDKFKTWLTKHEDHKIPTNLELREKNAQTPIQENAGDVPRIRNSEAIRKTIAAYSPDGNIGAFWGPGNATLRAKIIQEALGLAKLPAAKRATNTNFREVVLEAAGIPAGEHSQAKEDALFSEWVSGTKPSTNSSEENKRLYHVVAINEKTGDKTYASAAPMSHSEANQMRSRFSDHSGRRIQLEEYVEEQSKFSRPDSDLESLFEKLSSRSPKATREAALASIATLPQAERIQYVEDHFLDLLSELEETNKVDIKC